MYANHTSLKYLLIKKGTKAWLFRRILWLQEFDIEIRDKKEADILLVNHMSHLTMLQL